MAEQAEAQKPVDYPPGLIEKLNKWDAALDAHWGAWREEARTCFAMVAGDQLDETARQAAEDAGVTYAVINEIDAAVSAICGSEIMNRQEVRYFPREVGDGQVNDILTAAAEWARDECDAGEEESAAFRNCIICGWGVTETRMDYDTDPAGMPVVEEVDSLEVLADPSHRRPNAVDARYWRRKRRFTKDEAAERFGIDADSLGTGRASHENSDPHNADIQDAYRNKSDRPLGKDEIEVSEYQWFEMEPAMQVANPQSGEIELIGADEYRQLATAMAQAGVPPLPAQPARRRCYYRAFRIDTQVLEYAKREVDEFTFKAVTGKRDRNKGVWYGAVRAMVDPQRLWNKQISQYQRIIDHNAKGGLVAEAEAFEDPRQAEAEWARSDSIVWAKQGAIRDGRIMPKPVGGYPSAMDKMVAILKDAIPGVSGVNREMRGVIDREQAGVVDWQRKQAAYGVLACFFDSLKRYRKMQGRHLLKLITKYMSDGRLVRIAGSGGDVKYAQLAKQPETQKYDVIVDEAPAGPNQKERTFMFLTAMAPVLKDVIPPALWPKLLEYSPLPTSLVADIQKAAENLPEQKDPALAKAEMDGQIRQQQMAADQQAAQAKMLLDQQTARQQLDLESQKAAAALEQKREAAQLDADLAREKAQAEMDLAIWKAQQEYALAQQKAQWERELAEDQLDSQHEIGMKKASINGMARDGISTDRPGGSLAE